MSTTKCKDCGAILKQTQGKKAKQFCNINCRSRYWQRQKKAKEANRAPQDKAAKWTYDEYKQALISAQNIEECRQIAEKSKSSDLMNWQKEHIQKEAIIKSQQLDC